MVTFATGAQPNPVAGRTQFQYAIGADVAAGGPVPVSLTLHDLQGRLVRTLRAGSEGVGKYHVEWDARDDAGRQVGTGIYYVRFRAGAIQQNQKVSVVR
jgi:flagellar hook assembly protein FlgD